MCKLAECCIFNYPSQWENQTQQYLGVMNSGEKKNEQRRNLMERLRTQPVGLQTCFSEVNLRLRAAVLYALCGTESQFAAKRMATVNIYPMCPVLG